jgi:hypothetical protein
MLGRKVPGAENYPLSPILPSGYLHGFNGEKNVPPPEDICPSPPAWSKRNIVPLKTSTLTEKEVKAAVEKHVPPKDLKKVQGMVFNKIESSVSYLYGMRTFSELRYTKWMYTTYLNQAEEVDGPDKGTAKLPWDINVKTPDMFEDTTKTYAVSHTEQVVQCSSCNACGMVRCDKCAGVGNSICSSCAGAGITKVAPDLRVCQLCNGEEERQKNCSRCKGSGVRDLMGKQETCNKCKGNCRIICRTCSGNGQHACDSCEGGGLRKYYVRLIVKWITRYHSIITNDCGLEQDVIRKAPMVTVFNESDTMIACIQEADFFDPAIAKASTEFRGNQWFSNERVHQMNHWLCALPVTIVTYQRKAPKEGDKNKKWEYFHVYGDDHKVHSNSPLEGKDSCKIL